MSGSTFLERVGGVESVEGAVGVVLCIEDLGRLRASLTDGGVAFADVEACGLAIDFRQL